MSGGLLRGEQCRVGSANNVGVPSLRQYSTVGRGNRGIAPGKRTRTERLGRGTQAPQNGAEASSGEVRKVPGSDSLSMSFKAGGVDGTLKMKLSRNRQFAGASTKELGGKLEGELGGSERTLNFNAQAGTWAASMSATLAEAKWAGDSALFGTPEWLSVTPFVKVGDVKVAPESVGDLLKGRSTVDLTLLKVGFHLEGDGTAAFAESLGMDASELPVSVTFKASLSKAINPGGPRSAGPAHETPDPA